MQMIPVTEHRHRFFTPSAFQFLMTTDSCNLNAQVILIVRIRNFQINMDKLILLRMEKLNHAINRKLNRRIIKLAMELDFIR